MRRTRISMSLCAVVVMLTAACETDLTGINQNPNSPTVAPASALFTNATVSAVDRFYDSFQSLSMTSLFAQHIAQVQYVEEDRGRIRTETIDGLFAAVYTNELEDLEKVVAIGRAQDSPNTWGPALIVQSWIFQNMTDLWGDIPFSEALKGDIGGPLKPKYDPQEDIYDSLLVRLAEAVAAIDPASLDQGIGGADPIFHGDLTMWRKFGNSLRLRLAMRMQEANPTQAAAEISAALAAPGGVMTSNADNAMIAWPGDGVFDHPWATNFATRDDHRVSKTLMDIMLARQDPRIPIFAQPTRADPTVYAGLQNGLDNVTVVPFFNTTSRPGAVFYPGATSYGTFGTPAGKSTPSFLMTFAEVSFLRAEAAARGIGGQSGPAAYYDAGVRASILQWGGTDAQATAYLARSNVALPGGGAALEQIMIQKWIALFTQGTEAWSDWRRTGFPSTIAPGPSAYPEGAQVARRLPYPSNEQSVNAASLADAIARQGADTYATRVWWDRP